MLLKDRFEIAWNEAVGRADVVVQEKDELLTLISLMEAHGVRSYLELGASEGLSLFCIGATLFGGRYRPSVVDSVDLGEKHSAHKWSANVDALMGCALHTSCVMHFGSTSSSLPHVMDKRTNEIGRYDAILIDAGHSYENVKNDWEMYKDLGKMICFHDIRLPSVRKLWDEIGGGLEIHGKDKSRPMGFGVKFND